MNKEIETLYKKLEAQDKIINTQALEIARLRPLVDLLKEENNGVRKSFNDLQQKIAKAIEYIKRTIKIIKELPSSCELNDIWVLENLKSFLKILGDKE